MGSVVSTRPVQPIHTGNGRRRRSKVPMFLALAVVVIFLGSWLILGGEEAGPAAPEPVDSASQSVDQATQEEVRMEVTPPQEEAPQEATPEELPEVAGTVPGLMTESESELQPQSEALPVVATAVSAVNEVETDSVEVVEEPGTPSADEVSSGPMYAWIIASYTSQPEAEGRVDQLRESGLDANVYEATVRGQPAYRVGVGQFPSEAAAWRSHDKVPPEAMDAWITRVK